jgi:hypothetical protein
MSKRSRGRPQRWLLAAFLLALAASAAVEVAADYRVDWYSFGSGAEEPSASGSWRLLASIGRFDTGEAVTGGAYKVRGGFFARTGEPPLFADGFESGDTSMWTETAGASVGGGAGDELNGSTEQEVPENAE